MNALKRTTAIGAALMTFGLMTSVPGVDAGLRGRGPYDGVVFFDRWDDCILFSGTYVMYIATAIKEALRPYNGQSIEINAQEVFQPINPGDGLIRKFAVLGPSVHLGGGRAEDFR